MQPIGDTPASWLGTAGVDRGGLGEFRASRPFTLGVELELMLLDETSGQLASDSPALLRDLETHQFSSKIKAEIAQSMIEVNSGVHTSAASLEEELCSLCAAVQAAARDRRLLLCGGGAHPFRDWPQRDIFPASRFDRVYETYGYLAKQFAVCGQHIHVGVANANDALYLGHVFSRFAPHFIALSAASPFQRGIDTAFQSSRVNVVSMFPLSGHLPDIHDWRDFSAYFSRMQRTGLVRSMKDFYWDVRPKPEFGTVEIRVCDTPVTVAQAADLATLAQAIARLYLAKRPALDTALQYDLYAVNRFMAARFACDATILDIELDRPGELAHSIDALIDRCAPFCTDPGAAARLERLRTRARRRYSDAEWMRATIRRDPDWARLMVLQSARLLERGATEPPEGGCRNWS